MRELELRGESESLKSYRTRIVLESFIATFAENSWKLSEKSTSESINTALTLMSKDP